MAKKNLDILVFLVFAFPICFVIGPATTNINIFLINIFFLSYLFLRKNFKLLLRYKVFLIFYIYILISSILSKDIFFSLKSSIFFFRYIILIACLHYLVENKLLNLQKLYNFFLIIILAFFFDLAFEFFIGENLLGFTNTDPERLSSFFNQELIAGSYLNKLLLIISPFILNFCKKKIYFLIYALGFIAIFLTGERTAFYTLLLYILLYLIFCKGEKIKLIIPIVAIMISILIISKFNPHLSHRMSHKIFNQLNIGSSKIINNNEIKDIKNKKSNKIYYISIDHEAHFLAAFKIFKLNPFFGAGPNQYRNIACSDRVFFKDERQKRVCVTHPHNYYIQILSELGCIGFLLIIFFLIMYLKYFFILLKKNYKDSKEYNFILSKNLGIIIFLIPFLPSGNFFGSYGGSILFFTIGLLLSKLDHRINV